MSGPPSKVRRLAVNAIFLQRQMGGVETYVRELLPALLELCEGLEVTVFVTDAGRQALADEPWAGSVRLVTPRLLKVPLTKALVELTAVGHLADEVRADVVHSVAMIGPLRSRAASVVTIPDVIWLHEPGIPAVTRALWRTAIPLGLRHARRVIAHSQSARAEVAAGLHVPAARIDVVPHGPGTSARATPTAEGALRSRLGLGRGPIVLAVTPGSPHKNVGLLVDAIAQIRGAVPDVRLVVPGNPTPYREELSQRVGRLDLEQNVVFPGWVSAEDLEGLYGAATCFAFPSRREGFGLPVLEAMSRGVPVACARASALPEVAGDAALYFDPERADEAAGAIGRLLAEPELSERLREAGCARSAEFSWERAAEETLAVYERALAG